MAPKGIAGIRENDVMAAQARLIRAVLEGAELGGHQVRVILEDLWDNGRGTFSDD